MVKPIGTDIQLTVEVAPTLSASAKDRLAPQGFRRRQTAARVMALIVDEICRMPTRPMHIPMPQSPRLRAICETFLADPASRDNIDEWRRAQA